MRELLWLAGKSLLIALIVTPIVRDIFRSYNVVDRPGKRKVHPYPIPRVGGIAIAIAYAISLYSGPGAKDALSSADLSAWQIIPGAALVFFTGLLDDFFSLRPRFKLLGVAAAASLVYWSGVRVGLAAGHPLSPWVDYPATVFWLLLTSNALNLIDGLDGLCAGMGLMSTLTLFTAAVLTHNTPLAYATFPLAGALLGFLCFNLNPATVFLGDSGALLIGFLLGCYGMIWTQKASTLLSMLVPLLALSVPLLDVSLSVLRRFLRHKPIFGADKGHIHHRLLDRGLSPGRAVLVLYLVAALAAAFALLATSRHATRHQGVLIAVFCAAALFGVHKLRYAEFDFTRRFILPRSMDPKLKIAAAALGESDDAETWWKVLTTSGAPLGLIAISWESAEGARQATLREKVEPEWSFRVALSETDSIQVEGAFGESSASFDLDGFAEVLSRTFVAARDRGLRPDHKSMAAAV